MNDSSVNQVDVLLDKLVNGHSSNPYYLKQTLREIRSLVHQANLQADELIIKDWFKDFDFKDTIDTLTKEFPKLNWEEDVCDTGYLTEGTLGKLTVSVEYKVSFMDSVFKSEKEVTPYWELDIYLRDSSESVITLYNPLTKKFDNLKQVIVVIKHTLKPLCSLFSKLEIT